MAAEASTSKLRAETNGNGAAVTIEAPVEAEADSPVGTGPAVAPITPLPTAEPELSILSRGDSASGRWIIGGDGEVLGEFSGEIECGGSLLIGKGADITATIRGNEITIAGQVRGNVTAVGRLKITASGRLEGDARVGALVVQEGGVHHGVIRVHPEGVPEIDDSVVEAAPPAQAAPAPQTPVDRVKKFWGEFF